MIFSKKLKKLLQEQFKISNFVYYFFDRNSIISPVIYSAGCDSLVKTYLDEKLYHTDPTINYARVYLKPIVWDSLSTLISFDENAFFKFLSRFDIVNGITLTVKDSLGNLTVLNVLIHKSTPEQLAHAIANIDSLQMQLIEMHEKYLIDKRHLQFERNMIYVYLSDQEKNIVSLAAEGLTYKVIADKLAIKERTIKFHMKKLSKKLNVSNGKKALIKLKELNVI